jgi:hypothetical protein
MICSLILEMCIIINMKHLKILTTVIFTFYNLYCFCMPNTYLLYIFIFIFSAIALLLSILHLPCTPFYHTIPVHLRKTIWQGSANAQDQQKADNKCTKMAEDGLYSLSAELTAVCVLPSSSWQYENKILNCAYVVISENNAWLKKLKWSLKPCLQTYSIHNINCSSTTITNQTIQTCLCTEFLCTSWTVSSFKQF